MRMIRGFYNEQNNTVNVIHYDTNCIISISQQVMGYIEEKFEGCMKITLCHRKTVATLIVIT